MGLLHVTSQPFSILFVANRICGASEIMTGVHLHGVLFLGLLAIQCLVYNTGIFRNFSPSSEFSCVQGVDQAQLKQAKKLILELLHERKPHPLMIRLAWHDSGTYDKVLQRWPMLSLRARWCLVDMTICRARRRARSIATGNGTLACNVDMVCRASCCLSCSLLCRGQLLTLVSAQDVEDWPKRAGANGSLRFPKECAHGCNAGERLQQPPCGKHSM